MGTLEDTFGATGRWVEAALGQLPLMGAVADSGLPDRLDDALGLFGRWFDDAFSGFSFRGKPVDPGQRDRVVRRLVDATAFYGDPDIQARLVPAVIPAPNPTVNPEGRLPGGEVVELSWPSAYAPIHDIYAATQANIPQNTVCRSRWYRHADPRPTVIVVHGWGGGYFPVDAMVFRARWLFSQGLDVAMILLPLHAARAPLRRIMPPLFPSYNNPFRTNEAFAQAITDIRSLTSLLLSRGAPSVGLFGMSLGGYTVALAATAEPRLSFVVPAIPFASFADLVWEGGDDGEGAAMGRALGVTQDTFRGAFEATDTLRRAPVIDGSRVHIVYGHQDRVTPLSHAKRLRDHFEGSRLEEFRGAHLLQIGRQRMFDVVRAAALGAT